MKTMIKWMGILALVLFAAVSCEVGGLEPEQPEGPVGKIQVKMGAKIQSTKSTVIKKDGNRMLNFDEGDRLYVRGLITGTSPQKIVAGYLSIDGVYDGTSVTFNGDLNVYVEDGGAYVAGTHDFGDEPLEQCSDILGILVHAGAGESFTVDNSSKVGSYTTAVAFSVNDLMTKCLPVYGYYDNDSGKIALSVGDAPSTCTPIFNCALSGLTPDAEYTLVYRNGDNIASIDFTQTLGTIIADGTGYVAFACYVSGTTTAEEYHGLLLTNTVDGTDVRITSLGTKALASNVYNVTREAYPASVDLNTMCSIDANDFKYYAARDGQTITGIFGGDEGYITIADGATVTLNIVDFGAPNECDHAPIHCLGDAHIILADGSVNGIQAAPESDYPGIFIPADRTLTISGNGELVIDATGSYGAGIGGGWKINCGNIVIAGGVITAMSKGSSAAIGSGLSGSCGTITISGGVIKDALHVDNGTNIGAAIGSGQNGSCGAITISGGQIGGTVGGLGYDGAVATNKNVAAIGCGRNGSCGDITIEKTITRVVVTFSGGDNGVNMIGSCNLSDDTICNVYFGKVKVFDKTKRKWYDGDDSYDKSVLASGTYGDIRFVNSGPLWKLTPATATP